MPADAIPRADGELALSDKLLEALRGLGADGWMHGITGAEVRLKDETVLWFSAYGRDADATLATMRGVLAGRPVRAGSFALLYRGRGAKERTPLDPE